jgi:dTDP-4-amino-4,6-dideoxygalactose transaminase
VGSSHVPSEICSAFLYAQLEEMDRISERRREIYMAYRRALKPLEAEGLLQLPVIPEDCESNYHLFYVILPTAKQRERVLGRLKAAGVRAVFHYVPLHNSPKGRELVGDVSLAFTEDLSSRLIRMPFFHDLSTAEQAKVIELLIQSVSENHCVEVSETT